MDSQITFLGTAGDPIVYGKQLAASGGIIIKYDEMQLHINPGPGALPKAKEFEIFLRENDVLLVTENTTLAANDVNACVDAMTNGGLDCKGVLVANAKSLEESPNIYPIITPKNRTCLEKIIPIKLDDRVALNNVEIVPTPTYGVDIGNIGYKITTPHFQLSYLGNTQFNKKLKDDHKESNIVIINMPHVQAKTDLKCMDVDQVIIFLKEVKPKLCVITNFGIKMIQSDILNIIRTIQRESKVSTMAAKDGLKINPMSYVKGTPAQQKLI